MSQTKVKSGLLNFPDQTDFVKLPSGTTAQRPVSPEKGYSRYNTTDNKLEFWNGTLWQQLPGVVAPTIETVSYPGDDLAADPAGGQTITLTGTNFLAGASIEIGGTLASVVTVVSKTEITFEAPAKAAGDYDIFLTNGDNTTATFVNGISYNGVPSWTTPAGNLGSFPAGSTIPTITLVATEPDSGVISYSVTTGALPTGLTLTGADIDGNVPTPAGETTYNFSVTASDDENQESTERAFNIVVYLQVTNTVSTVDPFGDSSGVALYRLENNANDEGGVYNGTPTNVTYGTGVFGQAGVFNGSSSFIQTPLNFNNLGEEYSISMWVKFPFNINNRALLSTLNSSAYNGIVIDMGTSGELRWRFRNSSASVGAVSTSGTYGDNQWHQLVAVKSNTTNYIYVNGGAETNSVATVNGITHSVNAKLGTSPSNFYNGQIDQVRIFNRALTPLEVEALYTERTVLCGGQAETVDILGDNSCIALYPLDGNANDLSGNYSGTPTDVSYGVGEFDLAGVFNGSSSYIDLPNIVTSKVSLTVSAWFKTTGTEGTIYVDWNSDKNIHLQLAAGKINVSTYYGGTALNFNSPLNYNDGQWHHVVVSNNIIANTRNTWVDGNLIENNATLPSGTFSHAQYIGIGAQDVAGTWTSFFNGSIDQVRIFNKALSAGEVTTLYNETACDVLACGGTTNTLDILGDGSCIAAYPLDGSPADLSGNYNGVQTNITYPVGKFDLGGSFDGSSSVVTLPSALSDGVTTDATCISFWFNVGSEITSATPNNEIMNFAQSSSNFGKIAIGSTTGNFAGETFSVSSDVTSQYTYITENIPAGWNHAVVQWNSSTAKWDIYINSVAKSTNTFGINEQGKFALKFGNRSSFYFNGQLDQVRIFNKALSAGEVTTLYNETACN